MVLQSTLIFIIHCWCFWNLLPCQTKLGALFYVLVARAFILLFPIQLLTAPPAECNRRFSHQFSSVTHPLQSGHHSVANTRMQRVLQFN